jgi:hypothetical protein
MGELGLFSDSWCRAAVDAAADSTDLRGGMADPDTFDIVLAFTCTDRDARSWVRFHAGQITEWRPGPPPEETRVAHLSAAAKIWCSAADHDELATNLLLSRRIKLRDTRNAVVSNYRALDALLASWGDIPTDWTT